MKNEKNRNLIAIKLGTSHFLANMLALTKILHLPIKQAKELAKLEPGIEHKVQVEFNSDLSSDELLEELDEYEITVKITNQ